MPSFLSSLPFWLLFIVLFLGAMTRGQMMYWIGRLASNQSLNRLASRYRWAAHMDDLLNQGGADPGLRAIQRWGLVMVPLSYLTVGFQSMVQLAAGLLRITLLWYALAQIPGALAWAAIYSTIGFAVWNAALAAATGSPVAIAVIATVTLAMITIIWLRRRQRHDTEDTGQIHLDQSEDSFT